MTGTLLFFDIISKDEPVAKSIITHAGSECRLLNFHRFRRFRVRDYQSAESSDSFLER